MNHITPFSLRGQCGSSGSCPGVFPLAPPEAATQEQGFPSPTSHRGSELPHCPPTQLSWEMLCPHKAPDHDTCLSWGVFTSTSCLPKPWKSGTHPAHQAHSQCSA